MAYLLLLIPIKAIVNMKEGDDIDKENFDSIYGVLFFGVPNQGIRIEHWLAMVKGQPNENLVRNLGPDSTYLRTLHEDFRAAFGFLDSEVVAIYETERTRVAKVRIWSHFHALRTHPASQRKRNLENGSLPGITRYLFPFPRRLMVLQKINIMSCL